MANLCGLFDLDGTLVDSETLCNQAFLDLLPQLDLPHEQHLNTKIPSDFEITYRQHVSKLFVRNLRPIAGVATMLQQLEHPKCIASSGPLQKIKQALNVTGLAPFFGHNLFSSYQINSWKPEPDIFLYAAFNMGFLPEQCVVIEDSYGDVDLKPRGFSCILNAAWYGGYLPATKQQATNDWQTIRSADELAQWEISWGENTENRVFKDILLLNTRIKFWFTLENENIQAGFISFHSENCVGISNWFSKETSVFELNITEGIAPYFHNLPIVFWFAENDAINIDKSILPLGSMRVWVTSDS